MRARSLAPWLWLAAVTPLAGCASDSAGAVMSSYTPRGYRYEGSLPLVALDPMQLRAADPLLPGFDGWPIAFEVRGAAAGATCSLELTRGGAAIATVGATLSGNRCAGVWDGHGTGGAAVAPGALVVTMRVAGGGATLAESAMGLEVVRVGIDRIDATPSDAEQRAPLLYRRTGGVEDGWFELAADDPPFVMGPNAGETGGVALELPGRAVRAIPTPSSDLLSPALDASDAGGVEDDTFSRPMAWVAGARPTLALHLTTDVAGLPAAAGNAVDTEVRLVAPATTTIEGNDRVADGNVVTLEHVASPVPAVGRYDVTYSFAFEARRPDGPWQRMPGSFDVTLRYYGLVGLPAFGFTSLPHRAWVDVVDRIAGWVDGASAAPDAVASRIVEGIYGELGLRYDTRNGASFYTDYSSSGYRNAVFSMQAFEERDDGSVINCSDAASILSSYARMIGLRFTYHILTRGTTGFDLNFIRAIGGADFDDTPFDSGRGGFRYHAIVGSPDGRTWDATLAVDGDGSPAARPNTLLMVEGLDPDVYLEALSSEASSISTDLDDEVRIR